MDDQEHLIKLVTENKKLLEENNHILRSMRRQQRLHFWGRIVAYSILLATLYYSYTSFIQPTVASMQNFNSQSSNILDGFPFIDLLPD